MLRTLRAKLIFSYAAIAVLSLLLAMVVTLALARSYAVENGFRTLHQKKALASPYVQLVVRDYMVRGQAREVSRPLLLSARESIQASGVRLLVVDPASMAVVEDTSRRFNAIGQSFYLDGAAGTESELADAEGVEGTFHFAGESMAFQYIAQQVRLPARQSPEEGTESATPARLTPNILVFAQPEPGVGDLVRQNQALVLPAVIVALLASLVVGFLLARSISGPVTRLARAASAMSRGDYAQQVSVEGHGELASLTLEFNNMASEVARAHQMERDFVANVSHDLKTPLTSIQGFSQAMLDGAVSDEAGYRQAAKIINAEAQRMERLVSQLLDLSRLQGGLASIELKPTELGPLLAQLLLSMEPRAAEVGVQLLLQPGAAGARVLADADRLVEAFGNLLDNALKHTPQGGTVTVVTAWRGGEVVIEVKDTGRGIPPEDLPRVAERFYQVDKARSSGAVEKRGLGLGLAIAREIVQAHQGKLDIESTPGVGTTVRVTLLAVEVESPAQGERTLTKRARRQTRPLGAADLHPPGGG